MCHTVTTGWRLLPRLGGSRVEPFYRASCSQSGNTAAVVSVYRTFQYALDVRHQTVAKGDAADGMKIVRIAYWCLQIAGGLEQRTEKR